MIQYKRKYLKKKDTSDYFTQPVICIILVS